MVSFGDFNPDMDVTDCPLCHVTKLLLDSWDDSCPLCTDMASFPEASNGASDQAVGEVELSCPVCLGSRKLLDDDCPLCVSNAADPMDASDVLSVVSLAGRELLSFDGHRRAEVGKVGALKELLHIAEMQSYRIVHITLLLEFEELDDEVPLAFPQLPRIAYLHAVITPSPERARSLLRGYPNYGYPNYWVHLAAAKTLRKYGNSSDKLLARSTLEAVAGGISSPMVGRRRQAVQAIRLMGAVGYRHIDKLVEALSDEYDGVRERSLVALKGIAKKRGKSKVKNHIDHINALCDDPAERVRRRVQSLTAFLDGKVIAG